MRLVFAASALCLSLLVIAPPATSQTPTASSSAPPSAPAAADAAVKHAKRTACLKESKARKLVGAEKTAYLKNCIDSQPDPISASRQILPDRP